MKSFPLPLSFALRLACALILSASLLQGAVGDAEPGFSPQPNSDVYTAALQSDGKILIGGVFSKIGTTTRASLARLNSDGTLDTTFLPTPNSQVRSMAVQANGQILIGGSFTSIGGVPCNHLARLNPDGSLDMDFNADLDGTVNTIAIQRDGKILIGGGFTTVNTVSRNYLARLNVNGSLDTAFDAPANDLVRHVQVLPNANIFVAGPFTTLDSAPRSFCALLNSAGEVDMTFAPSFSAQIWCAYVQGDGRIVVAGDFTTINGTPHVRLARLHSNGTVDDSFSASANSGSRAVVVQADGKIVIGGFFTTVNGTLRNRLARLNSDGSLDPLFDPNANAYVQALNLQKDGRVLVSGGFSTLGAETLGKIARLENDSATEALRVTSATRIEWMRGGSTPESHEVTFELSTDQGANWSLLGLASRIPGGWELSVSSLPADGRIRARAVTAGGFFSGSPGLVESAILIPPKLELRQPGGTAVLAGGTTQLGGAAIGGSLSMTLRIVNAGVGNLTSLALTRSGEEAGDFQLGTVTGSPVAPGASADFVVTFAPVAGASGVRTTTLQIASNDAAQNPFSVQLQATALSTTVDTDGDGMNDWGEHNLAPLGFDWQVNNAALVQVLNSKGGTAGLYTASQIQDLHVGVPLLQRSPSTGEFTLTLGVEKSGNLSSFQPFPMTTPQTFINAQGRLEFRFSTSDGAAFFRIHAP